MIDHSALGDQAAANVSGFVGGAKKRLGSGVVPEPDSGDGVLGGMSGFHDKRGVPDGRFPLSGASVRLLCAARTT